MPSARTWSVHPGWSIMLTDMGVSPTEVLRHARLPEDLFARQKAQLSTEHYFRVWRAIEAVAADPLFPLRLGQAISVEAFDPAIFAALCSPDLNTALGRLAHYKPLVAPMRLLVDVGPRSTRLGFEWLGDEGPPPNSILSADLVAFVQLARLATRARIEPLEVTSPRALEPTDPYTTFFGVPVAQGPSAAVVFSAEDASRPFLTANDAMWDAFEPQLRRRLSTLDETASTSTRVRAALLELLPSGRGTLVEVAAKLGVSTRSLHRHLRHEVESFRSVLDRTREELARHYLENSQMSGQEISFLLGFDNPNSFYRAFKSWTGTTPSTVRAAAEA